MKVHFTANYDHKWPSRAMTFFPAGYVGTVKREVGERAIAKGRATEVKRRGKADDDAIRNDERPDDVVRSDTRPADAGRAGRVRGRTRRNRNGADIAERGDKLEGDNQ